MPTRTCVGCRRARPAGELVRLAASGGVLAVDRHGRLGGRGVYLCPDPSCVRAALRRRGLFSAALRRRVAVPDADTLVAAVVGGAEAAPRETTMPCGRAAGEK
ncbi:MAG TPA: YlxR family protein [Deltaproteobacteria bacterium]|nr:YlxR family protein [Deltaproteobacteria bacterium]